MKLKGNFKTNNITRLARVCVIATALMLALIPATAFAQLVSGQPQNVTVAPGGTASFTYYAMIFGTHVGTQWEVSTNSGSTWAEVSDGGYYSGATTSTLTISNVPASFNGYRYRCNVYYGSLGVPPSTSTSNVARLTVATPPTITSSDMFWYSMAGGPLSISLTATGTPPITWSITSGSLPTGLSLNASTGVISGTPTVSGTFTFRVRATNIAGYHEANFTLPVSSPPPPPSIVTHPVNRTITEGSSTSFTIATSTVEYVKMYQWQYRANTGASWNNVTNGGIYSGATAATLTLTNVPVSYNGYQYRCIASIEYTTNNVWSETSSAATLTVTSVGTPPVITTTSLPNGTRGTSYSATLAATGTTPITWSIISGSLPTGLSMNASSGIISGTPSAVGTFTFTVRASNGINPDATRAFTIVIQELVYPSISSHPADKSIEERTGASFSVAAINCTGTFSYQWQYRTGANGAWNNVTNSGVHSGATTSTLTLSSGVTIAYNGYQYRSRVTCSSMPDYPLYSDFATLTVTAEAAVIELTLPAEPFCTVEDYLSIPFHKNENAQSIQYSIRFSEDAKAAGFIDMTSLDDLPADLFFKINVPESAPTKLYSGVVIITCEGIENYIKEYPFTFSVVNNGVVIVSQPPAFQSLCGGSTLALAVEVTGNASSYQWYKNHQAIAGANGKEYVVESEGSYHVEIGGECSVLRSDVAVIVPPSSSSGGIGVRVKWGNVLYAENTADTYQHYQWYQNGTAIQGATFVYLSEKEGFLGEYYVRCYKPDGSFDETCPIVFTTRTRSSSVSIYPTVVKTDDVLNINLTDTHFDTEATIEIYSLLGIQVYSGKITTSVATIRPDFRQKGNYFVKITLSSGEVFSEKLIVQ